MLAPILTLAIAIGGVAHAGCEKDTDCKGDRICSTAGACVAPTPAGCDKDTDCPGDQICSAAGSCAAPGAAGSAPQFAGGPFLSSEEKWSFPSQTALANYERMRVTTLVNRLTSTNTAVSGGLVGVGPLAVGGGTSARVSEEGTRVRWVDGTGVTFDTDAALFDRVDARDWHLEYVDSLTTRARKDNLKRVWLPAGGAALALSVTGLSLARAEYCRVWEEGRVWEVGFLSYSACEMTLDEAIADSRASEETSLREWWSITDSRAQSAQRTYRYATLGAVAVTATVAAIVAAKRKKRYRSHQVPHRATIQTVDAYNRALASELGAAVEPGSMPDSAATAEQAYAEIKDKRSRQERR